MAEFLLDSKPGSEFSQASSHDVTIAAVAIAHRLTLLTDNKKHFPMSELSMQPLP